MNGYCDAGKRAAAMILADPAVRVLRPVRAREAIAQCGQVRHGEMTGSVANGATAKGHAYAMRPLPAPCHWIETPDGAFLRWNCGTVGYVLPTAGGARVVIQWRETRLEGTAASMAQGRRFLGQWIAGRGGPPFAKRKR